MKRYFYDLTLPDWQSFIKKQGLPAYRAGQLAAWAARGVQDLADLTDLPQSLREQIAASFYLDGLKLVEKFQSKLDDTVKYVFSLADGNLIESVLMHYRYGWSVCISSQAGCAMGCTFCASTGAGFSRSLSAGEMLAQVALISRDSGQRISNVTLMGIGEPLANYANTLAFLKQANDPQGLGIGMRHLTVSTCGLVPEMIKFTQARLPVTLSVSLHAPNDQIRRQLMPIANVYSYGQLLDACRQHSKLTGRRISFEYALFLGVNDQPEHADELAGRLRGMLGHVNLIPGNEFAGGLWQRSPQAAIQAFHQRLVGQGIKATIRRELGSDIMAACGQLRRRMKACTKP